MNQRLLSEKSVLQAGEHPVYRRGHAPMDRIRQFLMVMLCGLGLLGGSFTHAAPFIVDSLLDTPDASVDGVACDDGAGNCTLRAAIEEANFTPAVLDDITFSVMGTIQPNNAGDGSNGTLPSIAGPVTIIATPGDIEIDGQFVADTAADGRALRLSGAGSGGSTIDGLVINRFPRRAIWLVSSDSNTIQNNRLGTNPAGTVAVPNTSRPAALHIQNSDSNTIEGNLISGNTGYGAVINGGSTGNMVLGNLIGTDITGTLPLGNGTAPGGTAGIQLGGLGTDGNIIGNGLIVGRNIISGGNLDGVQVLNGASNNTVQGNYVGVNINGAPLGNGKQGIVLWDSNGADVPTGNMIIDNVVANNGGMDPNGGKGIAVDTVAGTVVQGNFVGTDPTGAIAMPNLLVGIDILNGSSPTVTENRILNNPIGVRLWDGGLGVGSFNTGSINNCVVNNGAGVDNLTAVSTTFTDNWWGSDTGPSGVGLGTGDSVSVDVVFDPWLLAPPFPECPTIVIPAPGAGGTQAIPTLSPLGLVVLMLLFAGAIVLHRRQTSLRK